MTSYNPPEDGSSLGNAVVWECYLFLAWDYGAPWLKKSPSSWYLPWWSDLLPLLSTVLTPTPSSSFSRTERTRSRASHPKVPTERDPKTESISSKNTSAGVLALACRNTLVREKKHNVTRHPVTLCYLQTLKQKNEDSKCLRPGKLVNKKVSDR